MGPRHRSGSPIAKRLREARERVGLSQRRLGILAGLDETVASPRINQYERGAHEPSYQTVKQLAKPLGMPAAFFFVEDDELAAIVAAYATGSAAFRKALHRAAAKESP